MLDPACTYLNHGTVGAPPRRVHQAQAELRDEIERQPARFMLRGLANTERRPTEPPSRLRAAADAIAPFFGMVGDEMAFVDNITTGANAVLRSLTFAAGDEILVTSLGYGAVTNTALYVASRSGAAVRTVTMPPVGAPTEQFAAAVVEALAANTRLLVVDHISAHTALVLPIREIVAACRAAGVLVLVDGAHAPGAIPLDIPSIGADFYTGNLHKWAWTPRSAGILWAAEEHRSMLHPTVVSWGYGNGFTAEFDLLGTRDPTALLTAPVAIAMLEEFGFADVCRYNHELAWWAGRYLSDRWDTAFTTPEEMVGAMVSVALPVSLGTTAADAQRVQDLLLFEYAIEAPVMSVDDALRTRVSAQVYVDRADIERLGAAVLAITRR
jgi:isopenicillin-N epimerase